MSRNLNLMAKTFVLGLLALVLIVILASINGLVSERRDRQHGVEREIAASYAGEQQITGPLLRLTVEVSWTEPVIDPERDKRYDVERTARREVMVYPETLDLETELMVEERLRGIFRARVFQSSGRATGTLRLPALAELSARDDGETRVVAAAVVLSVSDPRGISSVPHLIWDGANPSWESGTGGSLPGIQAAVATRPGAEAQLLEFSLELEMHGMGAWHFTPVASANRIQLRAPWPHPSFVGDFLPVARQVSAKGFEAEWRVNALASTVRQSLDERAEREALQRLGVRLIDPVSPYPLTDRALKYGFLFIGITFAAFLLYEVTRELRIHPIQYGFVGFAQALFFLLLLSFSEHIRFGVAYAAASTAIGLLLGFYLAAVLRSTAHGAGFATVIFGLYGALYGLLQSEDHALLAGSLLLFVLLSAVMLFTRKLDWYGVGVPATSGATDG